MNSKFSNIHQRLARWLAKPKARLVAMALGAGLLSACSTTPETVSFEQPNTDFQRVAQAPDSFVGNPVRWGGIVARVENLEKDTLIEIVNLPLDSRARPLASQNTGGRFIARVQGFVDPLIYKQGKEITVVGVLNQPMPGKIGEHPVNFPVVDSSGHHLWQQRQSYQHISVYSAWDPFWFGYSGYRWRYPYYGYPRYNYCPVHGAFHHHTVHHIRTNNTREENLPVAPSPTHRIQPLSDQKPDINSVERVTLREKPQVQTKPAVLPERRDKPQARKPQVYKPRVPKTPRRIHPKIHQERLPKPVVPLRGPMRVEN